MLSHNVKIIKVKDQANAATTDVNSDGVDMWQDGGFENVLFLTSFAHGAANNLIRVQASDDNGVADDWSDIAGGEIDLNGDTSAEDQWIDVQRPIKRYIRCVASRGTPSAMGDIWAILYRGRRLPVSNVLAGTIRGKQLSDAVEGTK